MNLNEAITELEEHGYLVENQTQLVKTEVYYVLFNTDTETYFVDKESSTLYAKAACGFETFQEARAQRKLLKKPYEIHKITIQVERI